MRTEIGLADLATAIIDLKASPDTASRIASLLGLAETPERRAQRAVRLIDETGSKPELPELDEPPRAPAAAHESRTAAGITDQAQVRLETTTLDRAAIPSPSWLQAPLAPPPRGRPQTVALPLDPLLDPRLTPAILVEVARTWHREGAVDSDAVADLLARREPATRVPRLFQPTLRMGVEVLVDRGEGMAPFEPDVEHLLGEIARVVGVAVSVRSFNADLLTAERSPRSLWDDYRLPPPGTPVLAVTDLGIARPAPGLADGWLTLAHRLRQAGSPFVALVPWPKRRHPRELVRQIPLLVWDRSTTPASIRAVARHKLSR